MSRFALGIEYDGTAYVGWQRQDSGIGVQKRLEQAVSKVADSLTELICAGRTDTGVHASGQVAHFDADAERSLRGWLLGINTHLPDDIAVRWIKPVNDDFHARFSAEQRTYVYRILNRLTRSALQKDRVWWIHAELNAAGMHQAAQSLLGEHDFSAFRAAACQSPTANREVRAIEVRQHGQELIITITANAFLHHMVRNIVGTLVAVGQGDIGEQELRSILLSRDRCRAGVTAPPQGLTLVRVDYPEHFGLPESN